MAEVINGVRVIPGTMLPESEWHEHVTKGGTADEFVKAHPGVKREFLTIKTVPYPRPVKHNVLLARESEPHPDIKRLLAAPALLAILGFLIGAYIGVILCVLGAVSLAIGALVGYLDDRRRTGTVDYARLIYVVFMAFFLFLSARISGTP